MVKKYRVNYGYTLTGRAKNRLFYTLADAQSFCNAYFKVTKQILSIEQI